MVGLDHLYRTAKDHNLAKLQLPLGQGGLAVPNIRLYQVASQFRYLADWVRNDLDSVWLDIEACNLG